MLLELYHLYMCVLAIASAHGNGDPGRAARDSSSIRNLLNRVVTRRAATSSGSPVAELEVALDAMCALQARFHGRYTLLSGVERRAGGQGVVQFANITGDQSQVRLCHSSAHLLIESARGSTGPLND